MQILVQRMDLIPVLQSNHDSLTMRSICFNSTTQRCAEYGGLWNNEIYNCTILSQQVEKCGCNEQSISASVVFLLDGTGRELLSSRDNRNLWRYCTSHWPRWYIDDIVQSQTNNGSLNNIEYNWIIFGRNVEYIFQYNSTNTEPNWSDRQWPENLQNSTKNVDYCNAHDAAMQIFSETDKIAKILIYFAFNICKFPQINPNGSYICPIINTYSDVDSDSDTDAIIDNIDSDSVETIGSSSDRDSDDDDDESNADNNSDDEQDINTNNNKKGFNPNPVALSGSQINSYNSDPVAVSTIDSDSDSADGGYNNNNNYSDQVEYNFDYFSYAIKINNDDVDLSGVETSFGDFDQCTFITDGSEFIVFHELEAVPVLRYLQGTVSDYICAFANSLV